MFLDAMSTSCTIPQTVAVVPSRFLQGQLGARRKPDRVSRTPLTKFSFFFVLLGQRLHVRLRRLLRYAWSIATDLGAGRHRPECFGPSVRPLGKARYRLGSLHSLQLPIRCRAIPIQRTLRLRSRLLDLLLHLEIGKLQQVHTVLEDVPIPCRTSPRRLQGQPSNPSNLLQKLRGMEAVVAKQQFHRIRLAMPSQWILWVVGKHAQELHHHSLVE
mmetsp:Transcript_81853/g.113656  ORF Transcript_81853/g.113656 Transcript_81853/m.113656 type:complete len:215 (-) Transcript_81853:167-811(-)